jgi:hypothetical protein
MSSIEQLPADVGLVLVQGDEFPFTVAFNADISGYTLTASVFNANTGDEIFAPTIGVTVDSSGAHPVTTLSFNFSETETDMLAAGGRFRWFLRWVTPGGVTRTVLSGKVKVQSP